MPSALVNATSDVFNPGALLSLYELDSRFIAANGQLFRFHPGVNGLYQPVVFNSLTYTPFPIEVTEMSVPGNGGVPRPKVRASNVKGFLSQFLLTGGDLVGARFVRRLVYARFLDAVNFPGSVNPYGTPDPTAAYDDEVYYVNRKVSEGPEMVEFECVAPFEIGNVRLPNRPLLATICPFKYLDGETCGYTGVPVSDRFGKLFTAAVVDGGYGFTLSNAGTWAPGPTYNVGDYVTIVSQNDYTFGDTLRYVCDTNGTVGAVNNPQFNPTNWIADACAHNILGCKQHYPNGQLPFGGAPGISRAGYAS